MNPKTLSKPFQKAYRQSGKVARSSNDKREIHKLCLLMLAAIKSQLGGQGNLRGFMRKFPCTVGLAGVTTENSMQEWRQERNAALAALDMDYARRMLSTASNDHVRLTAMHKARYECTDIAAEQRHQSGAWLRQHGYGRIDSTPLLPEVELPA